MLKRQHPFKALFTRDPVTISFRGGGGRHLGGTNSYLLKERGTNKCTLSIIGRGYENGLR